MPTLIVLGSSARAASMSALRAGWQPYAIDQFADRDLAAIAPVIKIARYPGDFLRALAAAPEAPWFYTGGLENYPRLVDRLAEIRPLMGNGGAELRVARELKTLGEAAQEVGCKFPRIIEGTGVSGDEPPRAEETRWLQKRRRSSAGLHVRMLASADLAQPRHGYYQQAFIEGQPASAVFVAADGRARLLGVTRQLLGADFGLAQPFVYVGSLGPRPMTATEEAKLAALGNALVERCRLIGLFNVDFIRTTSDIWALELNPRYSASIEVLERALGIRSVEWQVLACQANRLPEPAHFETLRYAGKAIVYAPRELTIGQPLDELIIELNAGRREPLVADLPRIGEPISRGSPVLTVLAEAESVDAVEIQIRERLAAVHRVLTS